MRIGGYEGHAKANELTVTHPLYMKRAYGEKPTYGEKSIWRKNSSVSVAKTDPTLKVQKLVIAKATGEREGHELQIQLLKAFYIPLGKPKHYFAQSKGPDVLISGGTRPC